ncbi:MAG: hypothetical protein CMJ48_14170 [Planctomycetaceae bacterium]|nr:hypothetical protein [Planctomycetaceae bacterium]
MNIPEVAWKNIRRTVEFLDVDHLTFRPPMELCRKFFRFLLQHQDERGAVRSVCHVCAPLYEGYSLKLAIEKKIPQGQSSRVVIAHVFCAALSGLGVFVGVHSKG